MDKLLDNPRHLTRMQFKARNLARPSEAYDIIEKLISLCSLDYSG
jgi:UDP-N-acetylglucosamine:LPS N-acetylglucosamine transferase